MVRKRPCCVPGCDDKTLNRYSIPKEGDVRDIWIERIGNANLRSVKPSLLTYYMVCERHFEDMCKNPNGKLMKYALPTINLPEFDMLSTRETCFYHPEEPYKFVTPEKVRDALKGAVATAASVSEEAAGNTDLASRRENPKTYKRLQPKSLTFEAHSAVFEPLPSTSTDKSDVRDVQRTPSPLPVERGLKRTLSSGYATPPKKQKGLLSHS